MGHICCWENWLYSRFIGCHDISSWVYVHSIIQCQSFKIFKNPNYFYHFTLIIVWHMIHNYKSTIEFFVGPPVNMLLCSTSMTVSALTDYEAPGIFLDGALYSRPTVTKIAMVYWNASFLLAVFIWRTTLCCFIDNGCRIKWLCN